MIKVGGCVIVKQDGYKQTIKKSIAVDLSLQKGVVVGESGHDCIVKLDKKYLETPFAVYGNGYNTIGWYISTINLEFIESSLEKELLKFKDLDDKDWKNIVKLGTGRSRLYTQDCEILLAKAVIELKKEFINIQKGLK